MDIRKVWALYFSATGTTKKVVCIIASTIAEAKEVPFEQYDITPPEIRTKQAVFSCGDLVVFGMPTYAGRIPNLLLKYLRTISGQGALVVPVVLFGNRDFDDSLIELCDIASDAGMQVIAAGAFVGEHSFSRVLAAGRPDAQDMQEILAFAECITNEDCNEIVHVDGVPAPYRGYYQPRDRHGNPIDIRKVKPQTSAACNRCGLCVKLCPMGSISEENPSEVPGVCIKCCACVKGCPVGAKYHTDAGYLYHKEELEQMYERRAQNKTFF